MSHQRLTNANYLVTLLFLIISNILFPPKALAQVVGIDFTPPEFITNNQDFTIGGIVTGAKEIETIYLFYRFNGEDNYRQKEMELSGNDYYRAIIPQAELTKAEVEYYIMAIDFLENRQYLLGFPKKPFITAIRQQAVNQDKKDTTSDAASESPKPPAAATTIVPKPALADSSSDEVAQPLSAATYNEKLSKHPADLSADPNIIVIEKEEIRKLGYRTLADILTFVPGLYVAMDEQGRYQVYSGGLDDRSAVALYINGQLINTLYDGLAAWAIPAMVIEELTIHIGPAAPDGVHGALGGAIYVELASGEHGVNIAFKAGTSLSRIDDMSLAGPLPHSGIYRLDGTGGFTKNNFNLTFLGSLAYGSGINRLIISDYLTRSGYSYTPSSTRDLPFSTMWGLTGAYNAGNHGIISFGGQIYYLQHGPYIGKIDTASSADSSQKERLLTIFLQHTMTIHPKVDYALNFALKQQSHGQRFTLAPEGYSVSDKNNDLQPELFPSGIIENISLSELDLGAGVAFDVKIVPKNKLHLALDLGFARQLGLSVARNTSSEGAALDSIQELDKVDFPESTFGRFRINLNIIDYWKFNSALALDFGARLEYFNESAMSGLLFAGRMIHPYLRFKWRLKNHLQLALSYRQGSRAPTWQERYSLTGVVAGFKGSDKLAPPVARQLGLDATHHGLLGSGYYRLVATFAYQWEQDGIYRLYSDTLPTEFTTLSSHGPLLKLLLRCDFDKSNYLELSAYWWRRQIMHQAILDTTLPQLTAQLKGHFILAKALEISLKALYVSERRSAGRNSQEELYPWTIGSYFRLDAALRTVPLWNHLRFGLYSYNTFDTDMRDPPPRSGWLSGKVPREGLSLLLGIEVE